MNTWKYEFPFAPLACSIALTVLMSCQMDDTKQWNNPADPEGANYHAPRVSVESDSLFVDSSRVKLRVVATSPNSRIAKIQWSVDGQAAATVPFRSSDSVMNLHVPGVQEASHVVAVHVQDETGLWSAPDTVRLRVWNEPPKLAKVRDTALAGNKSLSVKLSASDADGTIAKVYWGLAKGVWTDSTGMFFLDPKSEGVKKVFWMAKDDLGKTTVDSFVATFTNKAPELTKVRDTTLAGNKTLTVKLSAKDADGTIAKVYWGLENGTWTDSSGSVVLAPKAEGAKTVYWQAKDDLGKTTLDSFVATFTNKAPELTKVRDTSLSTRRTLVLTPTATDSDGLVAKYLFDTTGGRWDSSAMAPKLTISSTTERVRTILWAARDDLGKTTLDTFVVTFTEKPVLTPVRDTALSASKTLAITLNARDIDPTGKVVKYLWSTSGSGWTDSSDQPSLSLSNAAGGTTTVRWAVRNDQGKLSIEDTFSVASVPAPAITSLQMDSLLTDWTGSTGTVNASWSGAVPGFVNEAVTWTLRVGLAGSLAQVYQGTGTIWSKADVDSGKTFQCELVGKNRFGDSIVLVGVMRTQGPSGSFTDARDGQTYRYVTIGTQKWMAHNLNYRNTTGSDDSVGTCYEHNPTICRRFGRLYSWAEIMSVDAGFNSIPTGWTGTLPRKGICPAGWHVPSGSEWQILVDHVGGSASAGKQLKASSGWKIVVRSYSKAQIVVNGDRIDTTNVVVRDTIGNSWMLYGQDTIIEASQNPADTMIRIDGGQGNDSWGFSLVPSGNRYNFNNQFLDIFQMATFITSTPASANNWFWSFSSMSDSVSHPTNGCCTGLGGASSGYSLRCIAD